MRLHNNVESTTSAIQPVLSSAENKPMSAKNGAGSKGKTKKELII